MELLGINQNPGPECGFPAEMLAAYTLEKCRILGQILGIVGNPLEMGRFQWWTP